MAIRAVYIGRFSPMHLGHAAVIKQMLDRYHYHEMLILVGSANTPQSLRHFFSYRERRDFILSLHPLIQIAPLPDFQLNDDWFQAISDIIMIGDANMDSIQFFAGCHEDVTILSQYTQNIEYCNRFDGTTPIISATQVRDALIHDRDLQGMLHTDIIPDVKRIFKRRWLEFQNK